jgi:hypothetical protein
MCGIQAAVAGLRGKAQDVSDQPGTHRRLVLGDARGAA